MAYGGFPNSLGTLDLSDLEQDFVSVHPEHDHSDFLNIRRPPNINELNNSSNTRPNIYNQMLPRPEVNAPHDETYRSIPVTLAQTSRVRSNSDSSGSQDPTEENSPYGSPGQKHEEFVSSLENNESYRRDRIYNRDRHDTKTYKGRLATFEVWQLPYLAKEVLAEAGFYYIGPNDRVCCANCSEEIEMWEPGDDPRQAHRSLFGSDCF